VEKSEGLIKTFFSENVLTAAKKRIALIFDNFEDIYVSISGGKDSTVLFWLAIQEAERRNRKINAFFLDQEAEYQSSINLIEKMMSLPCVIPQWYQIPLKLTNATSYLESTFICWDPDKEWIRQKNPLAIQALNEKYPNRFYGFFKWLEGQKKDTAFLIGLRTEESLHRLRAVISNPGWGEVLWSTRTRGKGTFRFYPIYDWSVSDVWKCIYDYSLPYNSIYDKMYQANKNYYKTMRVSNLIHEKSFKCLKDLQVFEPETFNKLVKRLSGVHVASLYAQENLIFSTGQLPKHFKTWKEYRSFLLESSPQDHQQQFRDRFLNQPETESMCRKQVRQLLLNDYENNLDIKPKKSNKDKLYKIWWDVL
jgi:predicted phosphoadenosine phosphosulfate sulfurtransferase